METLGGDRDGQEILAAWIAKEKLRDVINLRARVTGSAPCERAIRGRLFTFYDWCAWRTRGSVGLEGSERL